MKRLSSLIVFAMLMVMMPTSVEAQSQNEVITTVLYDGTAGFTAGDPTDPTGTAPEAHTPGGDGGANNLVVRTHDQFAIRVDWNINEDAATNAALTVVLPDYAEWTVNETLGYSGCVTTTFSPNAAVAGGGVTGSQTVTCELGDQPQGSNGAIRMTAFLNEEFDDTTFDVTSTFTTDDDPTGVVDGLDQELTVSEAPLVDYRKNASTTSELLNNGTEDGYVVFFPLSFHDQSQGTTSKGRGPIDDSVPVELFDHGWNLTPSARLATSAEMASAGFAGPVCGDYDAANAGPYVVGNGTWACGAEITGAGGYSVTPITVTGFVSRNDGSGAFALDGSAPATLADGSANAASSPQISAGQIAFWLSDAEVAAAILDTNNPTPDLGDGTDDPTDNTKATFQNSIVEQDGDTVIASTADIGEIAGHGTNISNNNGATGNNTASVGFGDSSSSGGGSSGGSGGGGTTAEFTTGHEIHWANGPLQLVEDQQFALEHGVFSGWDLDADSGMGAPDNLDPDRQVAGTITNGGVASSSSIGEVARGQIVALGVSANVARVPEPDSTFLGLHQCVALDTSHYNITDLPADIVVRQTTAPTVNVGPATTLGFATTTPSDGIAHVVQGQRNIAAGWKNGATNGQLNDSRIGQLAGGDFTPWDYVVEVTNAPIPLASTGTVGIDEDGLTCSPGDAGSLGWVDASGDLSAFDADGDSRYEGITRIRIRSLEATDVHIAETGFPLPGFAINTYFNIQVLQDLDVNTNGQELHAFTSHAFTENEGWDGTADLAPSLDCRPHTSFQTVWNTAGNPDGSGSTSPSGWCSNQYIDDGADSFDTSDTNNAHDTASFGYGIARTRSNLFVPQSSGNKLVIVGASPAITKVNVDGNTDIADNDDLVTFSITPRVVGSSAEALTNMTVTDVLPAHYEYVSHTQPGTPGATCDYISATTTISCQYSQADPANPDGSALPQGLPGGWPAGADGDPSFTVTVMVTGAIANPNSATYLSNTAAVQTTGLGPWDVSAADFTAATADSTQAKSNSAGSFMPLPNDEGAIVKAVDTLEGPCDLHPTQDPPPVGWADRCSQIDHDSDMSFVLSLTNEGNTAFSNIEIIDVFPWNGDSAEPASETATDVGVPDGSDPNTIGDGRTPPSEFDGTLAFVSVDPITNAAGLVTYVTGDASATVSRDPLASFTNDGNTWCTAVGGTVVNGGSGTCPATPEDVTATYSNIPGDLNPQDTLELQLTLDSEDSGCNNIWTNTFGARVDQILLPIRSNDVSIMVNCEYDLALEKTVDPAFVPDADWITPGVTTIDFLMEVTNQGDPVEDFHVTDYVDTSIFEFDVVNNPDATTTGDAALPFVWDTTDPAAPVAQVDGVLADGESVLVPVTLTVIGLGAPLNNWAEISYFDSDGDPSNGDSDPTNANHPSTGPLPDEDSTPDTDQENDPQPTDAGAPGDGEIGGDGTGSDPVTGDEDDHDVAGLPLYDLELIKTNTGIDFSVTPPTATFELTVTNQSSVEVFFVDVTDYGAPGLTYDATATAAEWTAAGLSGITDANPTFTIAGPIAAGDSATIPIVYQMTDLGLAPFTNAAEISAFDEDDDNTNALSPFVLDVDSTPDAVNDDEVIDHNEQNYDPNNDGNINEVTPGDEDDHDIEVVSPYDLALTKTLGSVDTPLSPDGSITMLLTVENQAAPVSTIDIVDYIDQTMWLPFDATLNPDGAVDATSSASGFSFTWDATDPLKPAALVTPDGAGDRIGFGDNVVIPITLQPVEGLAAVAPLTNFAEISNFDNDEDATNGDASDGTIADIDSTPDAENGTSPGETLADDGGDLVDDELTGDGEPGNDEDDHDVISFGIYDLELIKTVREPGVDVTTDPWEAVFDITVSNQGTAEVFLVDVIEYAPAGLTYDAAATAALWATESVTTVTNASPTFTIEEIAAGDSITFPVVFDVIDLTQAPYVNAAEISAFDDDDDPANELSPFAFDVDSTPDAVNEFVDADGDGVDDGGDLIDQLTPNYDPDGDSDLSEATPGDQDDHDIALLVLPIDLALQKHIDSTDPDLLDGISNGDELTFFVEVFNQAGPIEDFHVTDYVSSSWTFDPALNAAGVTTGDRALPFVWDTSDLSAPVAQIDGGLDTDESVIIPVVLTVNVSDTADELFNFAEISYFDDDGDPTNGDSDPTNPNNPASGPLTDIDSTPDDDDSNDTLSDDVIDNTDGDEDDHDLAFTQWWDLELIKERSADQNYLVDFSTTPVTVSYDFTVNNQAGEDALNIVVTDTPPVGMTFASVESFVFSNPGDSGGTVIGSAANEFEVSQLSAGATVTFTVFYEVDISTISLPAVNTAEISEMEGDWDPDGPGGPLPADIYPVSDIDSTPDSDPTDDVISNDGTVDPSDSHNTLNNDPDGDGNLHNVDGIDEDDHDTEAVIFPFDLALAKTFVSADKPLTPGGEVSMMITITNQGPAVEQIDIVDYLNPAQWAGFDSTLNPDGPVDTSSTTAAAFSFTWDGTDPANPIVLITPDTPGDKLGFGETISVPITVQVADPFDATQPLVNVAEISRFDNDGDATNGDSDPANPNNPSSGPLVDIDSTPDTTNESSDAETIGVTLVDDAIDDPDDEDDHDPVIIPIMDLALRKTVDPSTSFPVTPGGDVTFSIEVINQGSTSATSITLVDYVDPVLWAAFDATLNPAGADYTWAVNANGQDGDVTITSILAPGQTVIVPVTLTIAEGADLEALSNTAEISDATASDDTGAEVLNPDGSPVVDIDSAPDTDNSDPLTDDVTDNTDGDEDDHDIAFVVPPTYSLGNQVWNDADNNGVLDEGEEAIGGVVVHLFSDTDGDGIPDDLNNDGTIDANDATATDTTGPDGGYLFEDLPAGDYIVGIAPENWDEGRPLDDWLSSDPTSTDPNDDIDANDDGTPDTASGYVFSGTVSLNDGEPTGETGLNNDPNTPDGLSNLTVDFGFWQPVFDLALEKRVADGQDVTSLRVGDGITYTIEVFNQGTVDATNISVVDYVPAALSLNDADWTATAGGHATIDLTGATLAPGESTTVDITMTILGSGDIDNHAEIANAAAIDEFGALLTEPDGTPIDDIDSNADQENADVLFDGEVSTNAAGGDEDDHDVASITVATAVAPSLAFTGGNARSFAILGLLLTLAGTALVSFLRREDQTLT